MQQPLFVSERDAIRAKQTCAHLAFCRFAEEIDLSEKSCYDGDVGVAAANLLWRDSDLEDERGYQR